MVPVLTAAVLVLGTILVLDLLVTFAIIRRLRAIESRTTTQSVSTRPAVGSTVGPFETTAEDGATLTDRDVAQGRFTFAFLLPECGGCDRVLDEIARTRSTSERPIIAAVVGEAGDPATMSLVASIPSGPRIVLSPLGGSMQQAFGVSTFPTVLEVVDGRIVTVGGTLDTPVTAEVAA